MAASADDLRRRLTGPLAGSGVDLEDVRVSRAGRRELVRVVIDRDGGVDLDTVAEASTLISAVLDAEPVASWFDGAYVLEVTSPGVDRPLVEPRHWRRAAGRLVEATLADGTVVSGRVAAVDESGAGRAVLALDAGGERAIDLGDVRRAIVQVEFNRGADASATDEPATSDE
ncbi:MAG: ribosome maturation factor RimP [Actinomycetales bacterium]|nr:ribosome maturation factor RimP [Actinomycetales bacterium]